MGSLVFDKCYPSGSSAADAFFSAKEPVLNAGSTSYLTWFEQVGGVWYVKRQSISETGVVTNLASSVATVPAFPSCDESQSFQDGLDVGWMLAALLVLSWGMLQIRRLLT